MNENQVVFYFFTDFIYAETANGTAPMEFAREILYALQAAGEDQITDWYNFHKLGYYTASMQKM